MIIRDFPSCRETVDDIKNITEKRRYILIFRYDDPIHHTMNCIYDNLAGNYDVYLINESVTHGINYKIPNNITLFQRNQYRGIIREPLNGDVINHNAELMFFNASYTTRIRNNDRDIIKLSSQLVQEGNETLECEVAKMLNSELIVPFPKFYNTEDQSVFDSKHSGQFVGDFWMDFSEIPTYKFSELIDPHTKIAIVDMPNINNLINISLVDSVYADGCLHETGDSNIQFNDGLTVSLEDFKEKLTWCFIEINKYVLESIFSQVDVVIDAESGLFNILQDSLRIKFRELSKKNVIDDLKLLTSEISTVVDNLFGESDDMPCEIYENNLCPNRIYIHISNTGCKIKVSNTHKLDFNKRTGKMNPMFANGESSIGDADEIVACECCGLRF